MSQRLLNVNRPKPKDGISKAALLGVKTEELQILENNCTSSDFHFFSTNLIQFSGVSLHFPNLHFQMLTAFPVRFGGTKLVCHQTLFKILFAFSLLSLVISSLYPVD